MLQKLEFDFELGEPIVNQIRLMDKVLSELNVASLNENPDFIVNRESAATFGLDFQVSPQNKNTVNLWLVLEGGGLRIDIDLIPETFEWSNKTLEESEREVIDFIKELFTSYILLEYFPSRTTMSLFNSRGVRTKHYTLRKYLSLMGIFKRDSEQSLFFPIYQL
jgi:hypothetical protein